MRYFPQGRQDRLGGSNGMSDNSSLSPHTIQRLAGAVPQALAMLAGMELDVFTPLAAGPLTIEQIANAIGVSTAKLQPVLAALVATGLLMAEGNRFANTPEANHFLVRGRPTYMGSVYELWSDMWRAEFKTAKSVRSGIPQAKHDFAAMSPDALHAFVRGSHSGAVSAARALLAACDLSAHRNLLDVGGGSGGLAITLTQSLPNLHATVVELPIVAPITQQFIADANATKRVQVIAADAVRDTLTGMYDIAVCNRFIQVLAPHDALDAMHNLSKVVAPNGVLHMMGHVLDDSGLSPSAAVAYGLLAINLYDGGQAYTERQHREWLRAAGFVDIARMMLANGYSLMSARKQTSSV